MTHNNMDIYGGGPQMPKLWELLVIGALVLALLCWRGGIQ